MRAIPLREQPSTARSRQRLLIGRKSATLFMPEVATKSLQLFALSDSRRNVEARRVVPPGTGSSELIRADLHKGLRALLKTPVSDALPNPSSVSLLFHSFTHFSGGTQQSDFSASEVVEAFAYRQLGRPYQPSANDVFLVLSREACATFNHICEGISCRELATDCTRYGY